MKTRDIRLNWLKTGPGHYEEPTSGFAIIATYRGRYDVLDPTGQVIYRAACKEQAFGVFEPIPLSPGELVTMKLLDGHEYEWRLSDYPWNLKDVSLLNDSPSTIRPISILPPMTLPQEIRCEFMWGWDSIKNAYYGILDLLHPKLLDKYACRYCRRPALTENVCPVCVLINKENNAYRKTLYKEE